MPESYQKTIGFPTYDLLAAVSLRMEGTDTAIDEVKQQLDPENLHDSALDRYIYPRSGLERKAATFAHGSLTVTGTGMQEMPGQSAIQPRHRKRCHPLRYKSDLRQVPGLSPNGQSERLR